MGGLSRKIARFIAGGILVLAALALGGCAQPTITSSLVVTPKFVAPPSKGPGMKTIYFAGGCFWGIEKYLEGIHGVVDTETGYANGASASAAYGDGSGYAETVRVDYDPAVAPLPFLLRLFYKAIDPTSIDQQGNDVGAEYRSGIYYTDPADQPTVAASLARLQKSYDKPIAVESGALKAYARAEDYHQKYLDKNPGGYCHIPFALFGEAASATPLASDFATSSAAGTAP